MDTPTEKELWNTCAFQPHRMVTIAVSALKEWFKALRFQNCIRYEGQQAQACCLECSDAGTGTIMLGLALFFLCSCV
eukprot:1412987-Amphidinium_carterae.2